MTQVRISDQRSLGSWYTKGIIESTLGKVSSVPLMCCDLITAHGSLIMIQIRFQIQIFLFIALFQEFTTTKIQYITKVIIKQH